MVYILGSYPEKRSFVLISLTWLWKNKCSNKIFGPTAETPVGVSFISSVQDGWMWSRILTPKLHLTRDIVVLNGLKWAKCPDGFQLAITQTVNHRAKPHLAPEYGMRGTQKPKYLIGEFNGRYTKSYSIQH